MYNISNKSLQRVKIVDEALKRINEASKTGAVVLDLSNLALSSLPPEIGQLTNITSLNLGYNKLNNLPDEITRLKNLTSLNLEFNCFKYLPSEICQLTKLTSLSLNANRLNSIPAEVGHLINLTTLNLQINFLISLPDEIVQLTKLTSLNLGHNKINSLPEQIGQLIRLNVLDLSFNSLNSICCDIGRLTNLSFLDLHVNKLKSIPLTIGQLTKLLSLNLSYNNLESIPSELGKLSKLTTLNLGHNTLSSLPVGIEQLSNIITFDISFNNINSLVTEIGQLTNLKVLNMEFNKLTSIPNAIGQLTNLTSLDLNHNKLNDLPFEIGHLSSLTQLNLTHNNISSLPVDILHLSKLVDLETGNNSLVDPPEVIAKQGLEAIRLYLKEKLKTTFNYVNEVKIHVVGRGRVGKTSLLKRLKGEVLDLQQESTLGINNQEVDIENDELIQQIQKIDHEINFENTKIKLRFYDFGGQRVFYPLHYYFFTENSIYLYVTCPLSEDEISEGLNDEAIHEYWMYYIESYAGQFISNSQIKGNYKTPVLFVVNKMDLDNADNYICNIDNIKKRHLRINIYDYKTSCKENYDTSIKLLKDGIKKHLIEVPIIKSMWITSWFKVKEEIETSNVTIMEYKNFRSICEKHGMLNEKKEITDEIRRRVENIASKYNYNEINQVVSTSRYVDKRFENAIEALLDHISIEDELSRKEIEDILLTNDKILANALHMLGIILYFENVPGIGNKVILDPRWVAEAVYTIVASKKLNDTKGILDRKMMKSLLKNRDTQDCDDILCLMEYFKICYRDPVHSDRFYVPQAFMNTIPEKATHWLNKQDSSKILKLVFEYKFFPLSIMPAFICSIHNEIKENTMWQKGVLLRAPAENAEALIICNDTLNSLTIGTIEITQNNNTVKSDFILKPNTIFLAISGEGKRDYSIHIKTILEQIQKKFNGLEAKCFVPCPSDFNIKFDYEHLIELERNNPIAKKKDSYGFEYYVKELLGSEIVSHDNMYNFRINTNYSDKTYKLIVEPIEIGSEILHEISEENYIIKSIYNSLLSLQLRPRELMKYSEVELSNVLKSTLEQIFYEKGIIISREEPGGFSNKLTGELDFFIYKYDDNILKHISIGENKEWGKFESSFKQLIGYMDNNVRFGFTIIFNKDTNLNTVISKRKKILKHFNVNNNFKLVGGISDVPELNNVLLTTHENPECKGTYFKVYHFIINAFKPEREEAANQARTKKNG